MAGEVVKDKSPKMCQLCLKETAVYLILDEGGFQTRVCPKCEQREYKARMRVRDTPAIHKRPSAEGWRWYD